MERLRLWDVAAGLMALPPGPVEIGAGASSTDIRQTVTLRFSTALGPGASALPASAAGRGGRVAAADFDDYANIALVDTTRAAGTAVTPADPTRPGWLRFITSRSERKGVTVFRTACSHPSGGRIEVWLAPPDDGRSPLASVPVPDTGGRYEWTEVSALVPLPADLDEVYLALHGPVRLDWFRL